MGFLKCPFCFTVHLLEGRGKLFILSMTPELHVTQSSEESDLITDLAFNPTSENGLITGSGSGHLTLQSQQGPKVIRAHSREVSSLDWTLNGLLSSSWDGSVKLVRNTLIRVFLNKIISSVSGT